MYLQKRKFCFTILTLALAITGYAQEIYKGTVQSAKDSSAIAGASVYFDGTNIGVSTDIDGKFLIKKGAGVTTPLIVSSLGYKTLVLTENSGKPNVTFKIYLQESTESLDEVHIETDPWTRKKKLEIFRREFLGNTANASLTKIKNEEAIKLRYIPSKKIMVAYADEPLIIKNTFLGYEVRYDMEDFKVEFTTGTSGLTLVHLVSYEGYTFFNELKKAASKKHLKNREKTYNGSSLHFLRSLASKKLHENGFKIFHEKFEVPPYSLFQIDKVDNLTKVKLLEKQVIILHGGVNQSIIVAEDVFYIDQFGNHSPSTNVIFGGEMGNSRLAKTLPTSYNIQPSPM